MTEAERGTDATLFPARAGERLRQSREAQGLSLAEVAMRTRVPLRHLEAIETSDYSGLPSPTYAVGFARAYARAVGADEVAIAAAVRAEVAQLGRRTPEYQPYVTADPARLPSRGLAIVAAGVALAVLVLAVLWFGTLRWHAATPATAPTVASVPEPAAATSTLTAPTGGQVRLTATDDVWLRVYDAANKTLRQGTLKPGESYDVPADADRPMINVGRPDKLQVTLNGSAVPALGDGKRAIKDVPVGGAAIAARLAGAPIGSAPDTPVGGPSTAPTTPPPAVASPSPPSRRDRAGEQRRALPTPRRTPRPRASPDRDAPENLLPSGFSNSAGTP